MTSLQEGFAEYLHPGRFIDSDAPALNSFAREVVGGETGHRRQAMALYYAIRDHFPYDPYRIDLSPEAMRASAILERGYGFCIPKAMLLAGAARVWGIPSRLGFADVRNHLTTARLRRAMGTDLFVFHGFAELYLEGRWIKATPAFNRSLCEKFGVPALEFDGVHDSVFQEADVRGNRFMEYVNDRGRYPDLPLEELCRVLEEAYPEVVVGGVWNLSGRFEDDAVADREGRE